MNSVHLRHVDCARGYVPPAFPGTGQVQPCSPGIINGEFLFFLV